MLTLKVKVKKIHIITSVILLISVIGAGVGLFASGLPFVESVNAAEVLANAPIHIGVVVLFLLALQNFRVRFKMAYIFMCLAVGIMTLGMLQYAVLGSVNALDSAWVTSGAVEIPFIIMSFCYLAGLLTFAQLMGIRRVKLYAWLIPVAAVLVSLSMLLVPSPRTDIPAQELYLNLAIYSFEAAISVCVAILAYQVRKHAGPLYVPAFAWMFASSVTYVAVLSLSVFLQLLVPADNWFLTYGVSAIFYIAGGLLMMRSAIELNRISYIEPPAATIRLSFFGKPQQATNTDRGNSDAIDAIIYLASLSSNITALDEALDKLRSITAQMGPGDTLQPDQQMRLVSVYRSIEDTLVNEDQVGRFSHENLRERVLKNCSTSQDIVFWNMVYSHKKHVE